MVVQLHSKYLQVLHVRGNVSIAISNIDFNRDKAKGVSGRVFIYDSILDRISLETKQYICTLVRPVSCDEHHAANKCMIVACFL